MNYFSSDFKLGILGGGQLGKMLLFDTRKFDIQTYVLDPSEEAPCKIACNKFFQGDLMDFGTVYNFGKQVNILTFEIELVNLEALEKLENEGMNNLENLMKTGKQFDVDKLLNIMSDGANKFKQQTGRNLTYSELRELYG